MASDPEPEPFASPYVQRIDADHLRVRMTALGDDGTIGDGMIIIDRSHPQFAANEEWLVREEIAYPAYLAERNRTHPDG
jgi:hypothetical protein